MLVVRVWVMRKRLRRAWRSFAVAAEEFDDPVDSDRSAADDEKEGDGDMRLAIPRPKIPAKTARAWFTREFS